MGVFGSPGNPRRTQSWGGPQQVELERAIPRRRPAPHATLYLLAESGVRRSTKAARRRRWKRRGYVTRVVPSAMTPIAVTEVALDLLPNETT